MILKKIWQVTVFLFILLITTTFLLMAEVFVSDPSSLPDQDLIQADADLDKIDFNRFMDKAEKDLTFDPGEKKRPEPERKKVQPSPGAGLAVAVDKEQQMVQLVNQARVNAGLPLLQVSSQLTAAARAKSKDMIDFNYFSHNSPTYGDFVNLLKAYGVGNFRTAAENLAMNSNGSVSGAHNMLMGSPGHRANILNGSYSIVGVGIQIRSDGSHFYTQLFVGY
jgi:uncharacterized protein YkwD